MKLELLLFQTRSGFEASFGHVLESEIDDIALGSTATSRLAHLFQLPEEQFLKVIELAQLAIDSSVSKKNPEISKSDLTVAQTSILFYWLRRKKLISGNISFSTLFTHVKQITGHSSVDTLIQYISKQDSLLKENKKGIDAFDHEQVIKYLDGVKQAIRQEIGNARLTPKS
ncbi:hypothetical protein [Pontibacter fetidus]|uniref:Uncharacterized protein n=1 Tax=Pontibacter fetidus TaxID=2700082 RepID=A0A6B2H959_9BACT|nr:hypothetical protein [Pontibacter fetidus]NDK57696.1 hypothetical protein [Pontibacter fetidus]